MSNDWLVGDRRAAAAERIYAAAADIIAARGIDAFDMAALEARVHCSRATIYRHAGGKNQIRDAVLARSAEQIVAQVRAAVADLDGTERAVTAVAVALDRIRADSLGRALIASARSGGRVGWIADSPQLAGIAAKLTGCADDDAAAAQWIVRVVLSFVVWPLADPELEREMLRRFLTQPAPLPLSTR
ncbi:MAG: TetR/AcrR family transcriptional regulator [Mycobacterium kyogaense]|uniref:TetR/AcrR family transcriptional regulator n=1 Tax=Mycobacterium kyogaense TaxID=2212479 RepID=UPI002FF9D744